MRRFLVICISTIMLFSLSACEKKVDEGTNTVTELNEMTDDNIENVESVSVENVTEASEKKSDNSQEVTEKVDENSDSNEEQYVGEYNAYDIDEPGLEIQQNDDGTYKIQIGIYRLIQLDECVGERTEKGMVFSTKELGDKDIRGTITIEDDVATVTFTGSDWSSYSEINEYKYYKTSDVPNIYEP